jgi:hypothetical protein
VRHHSLATQIDDPVAFLIFEAGPFPAAGTFLNVNPKSLFIG